jgi:hypothetical protein
MRTQEQAFQAYYASMTDEELLMTDRNRGSFIPLAQTLLAEELLRRHLTPPAPPHAEAKQSRTLFTKLRRFLRRGRSETSPPAKTGIVQPERAVSEQAPRAMPEKVSHVPASDASSGATEDHMQGVVPERINKEGTKVEDLAGTEQHDSLGG